MFEIKNTKTRKIKKLRFQKIESFLVNFLVPLCSITLGKTTYKIWLKKMHEKHGFFNLSTFTMIKFVIRTTFLKRFSIKNDVFEFLAKTQINH